MCFYKKNDVVSVVKSDVKSEVNANIISIIKKYNNNECQICGYIVISYKNKFCKNYCDYCLEKYSKELFNLDKLK